MDKPRVLTEFARVINSDRYQYTQSDIFLMEKMEEKIAVFDVFFRKTADGGFAVVAGVQEVINLIEILNSTSEEEKREYVSKLICDNNIKNFKNGLVNSGWKIGFLKKTIGIKHFPYLQTYKMLKKRGKKCH